MDALSTIISTKDIIMPRPSIESVGPTWHVPGISFLPRVPPFYTLERTRVTVNAEDGSPPEVAQQISSLLQVESLDATFYNDQATAIVRCPNSLAFVIQMYQAGVDHSGGGEDAASGRSSGFIVEVQKKGGDSLRYHKYARTILRTAASGIASEKIAETPVRLRQPPRATVLATDDRAKIERDVVYTLERATSLFQKDRLDANILGMESLVLLSGIQSSGNDRATCTSQYILGGPGFKILRTILKKCLWPKWDAAEDFGGEDTDMFEKGQWESMKERALVVLGNALSLLAEGSVFDMKEWIADDGVSLDQVLVEEIKAAELNPENSYQALRSLNSLISFGNAQAMSYTLMELNMPAIVSGAQRVGRLRHALLGEEATRLLAELENVTPK